MPAKGDDDLSGEALASYMGLVKAFLLASIKCEDHLRAAQMVMDRLLATGDLDLGQETYLDALSALVATHEDVHHRIEPATDADKLQHFMEARGVSQAELSRETGISRSSISEILSGKKPFTRPMIRKLATYLGVDGSVLPRNF